MDSENPKAQNAQPISSTTRNGETGFKRVHLDVVEETPIDLKKTEIAKNLVGLIFSAAGMIAGVQIQVTLQDRNPDPAVKDYKSALNGRDAKKQLEIHLSQYEEAGYLEKREDGSGGKNTSWTTTAKFQGKNVLFALYKDIEQYCKDEGIADEELERIGCSERMQIRRTVDKADCRDPITHLYRCCKGTGVDNITTTDVAGQFDDLPFEKICKVLLENALSVQAGPETRTGNSGTNHPLTNMSPLLGRVLVLAAMCGIRTLQFSDIPIILAKAGLFESVVRSRIALLRQHHPSQIINTLLFGGKTESHGTTLLEQDGGAYTPVGKIEKADLATFSDPWKSCNCAFKLERRTTYTIGRPIYMSIAWARLLSQRKAAATGSASNASSLATLTFIVVETDGALFAQPSGKDTFMSKSAAGSRHYGGIVGPTTCDCATHTPSPDRSTKWKYNDKLTIPKAKKPDHFLRHASNISSGEMVVLDYRGDWPTGVFYMQALPQSSYVQGKRQCLKCAIRSAAAVGCPQVIACGVSDRD